MLLLAACAAPRERQARAERMSALVGADQSAVVARFGQPTTTLDRGALRTLIYERQVVEGRIPRQGLDQVDRPRTASFPCRLVFTLEEGRVRSFDQVGPGC